MLKKSLEDAINDQINAEIYSAYLYFAMSASMEEQNLPGFANWFYVQAQEEMTHAMKFYRYLLSRNASPAFEAIKKPEGSWNNPLDAFKQALEHEQYVTDRINKLVDLSAKESDHATANMLVWFVDEQVEEEENAQQAVDQLGMIDGSKPALFMLDREYGSRVFVDETQAAQ